MTYEYFKKKVYSHLISYKKENLGIVEKGISSHGVEHDCLFPKPYCEAKLPSMLYADIKPVVVDIQSGRFAYKPHLAASAHVSVLLLRYLKYLIYNSVAELRII